MTISSSTRKAGPTAGNGVTDTIPFTFKVFTEADLVVVQRVTATDVETTLVLTTDYTVSLNADQDADPGGDIVIVDPATDWPTGTTITVTSELSPTQAADITNRGGFYASVINAAFDKLTILVQQLYNKVDRSLKFPISDSGYVSTLPGKAELANNVLAFDSNGDPVAGPGATNMQALIDAAEAVLLLSNAGALSYSNTSSGLAATNAQDAIDEVDADLDTAETKIGNLITLSGVAANSTSLGTFTGGTIADNRTVKQMGQDLETALEATTIYKSGTVGGTANAITATCSPIAQTAYTSGFTFVLIPTAENTSTTVTIAIDGLAAKQIWGPQGYLNEGDLQIGHPAFLRYDGSRFRLLNPANGNCYIEQPAAQAYVKNTTLTFTTTRPGLYYDVDGFWFSCNSTDAGYAVGDVIRIPSSGGGATANCGWSSYSEGISNTEIKLAFGSAGIELPNKSTRAMTVLADSKWDVYPRLRISYGYEYA